MATETDWERDRRRFRESDPALADGPLADEFVALANVLFAVPEEAGVLGLLEHVTAAAERMVPGADLVSVVLRADGAYRTVTWSDPIAVRIDELQQEHGEGPGLAATEDAGAGLSIQPDLDHCPWPRFASAAAVFGVHAALSTGMFPGGSSPRFGALNYYARTRGGLDAADSNQALLLAAHAATAVAGVQARTATDIRIAQLEAALDSRDVIGQAKGILMERRGLDADAAFDVLRRTSQDLNVKLRDIAQTLVGRRGEL